MNERENEIVPQIILTDLKYLSVRQLYFNWFFSTGAETANHLFDSVIKVYLKSIEREDLIKEIRSWKGNETHNVVRIIKNLIDKVSLDFEIKIHEPVLENIYKLYKARYLEEVKNIGACRTLLRDLDTIDYTYKYFRDKVRLSDEAKKELLIDKLFLNKNDILWGEDRFSLYKLFYRENKSYKIP